MERHRTSSPAWSLGGKNSKENEWVPCRRRSPMRAEPSDMRPRIRVYARRMTSPHPRWDAAGVRDDIGSTLQEFVHSQAEWLDRLGPDARRLVEHARVSVSGGKRFRAAFCWWGHHAVAEPTDRV